GAGRGGAVFGPALAGEEADELGAVARVGADRTGGLAGGPQGVQTGDDEARQQRDGGGRQLGGGEKRLGEGQRIGEDHGRDGLCERVERVTGESITPTPLHKAGPFFVFTPHCSPVQRNFIAGASGCESSPGAATSR